MLTDPSSVDFVIYHAECSDGFGAAFAAWKLLGDRAVYFPAKHGHPAPDVTGRNVIILDFAYDNATTKKMIKQAESFLILDHHKSSMINLHDVSCACFDMSHSGAYLAWKFFHPGKDVPRMIKHIEDRDLWKWEIPYSREFSAAFDMVPFTFEDFDKYMDDSAVDDAQERGAYILAYSKTVVTKIVKKAAHRKCQGKDAMVVNAAHWVDEIGHALALKADFAIIWRYDHDSRKTHVSLRAHHEDTDVSEIAKHFGGGGHRTSSAFTLPEGVHIESIFDA
jgi:hypothetical protein